MSRRSLATLMIAVLAAGAFVACSDESPVAAGATRTMTADVVAAATLDPFTFRAPLDPYRIHRLPAFMMQSNTRADLVIQRVVFAPEAGGWHTRGDQYPGGQSGLLGQ